MVSQLQVLNKILSTKDFSIIILNNLNEDYFFNYKKEFNFIKQHIEVNKNVPDQLTFLAAFPDFEIQEVTEPDSYLLEQLYKDYNAAYLATRFNTIKKLLEEDKTNEAVAYFRESVDNLHVGGATSCIDLIQDTTRFDHYLKKVSGETAAYISTGFLELDQILGGLDKENENLVIAGRPGQGKTQIMLRMAVAAAEQGYTVGIYEGEMSHDKLGYRIDTFLSHISNTALNRGKDFIEADYTKYIKSLKDRYIGPIKVITQSEISGPANVDALRAFVKKEKIDILFIDQYSLLEDSRHARTDFEHIGNIAKDIKLLQVEMQIPIVSVSQMNRTKNENGEQDTSQVAGSDKISQYATTLIMLDQKTVESSGKKVMQLTLNIVKARDGGNGNKLTYVTDFNTGVFNYIPQSTDGICTEKSVQELQQYYDTPF